MKKALFFVLFPLVILAQTNVDNLVEKLDRLNTAVFDDWKCSTNFSFKIDELSDPNFDDSQWQSVTLNERLAYDSCLFRKVIELPPYIAGVPVKGSLKFLTEIDDYGYLWIDGESKGYFPWNGEFQLTDNAWPGQQFVIVIKAINSGGPLRIITAKVDFPEELPIQNLISNLSL